MLITTNYKPGGTKTFRLSASQWIDGAGVNLQNPPEALLNCLIPPPGYKFGYRDQSGAEALIVAYEAPDGRFRQLFKLGIKPHVYLALQIFIEKFRSSYPKERYYFREPRELKALPEWSELNRTIKHAEREYFLGKKTIHAKNYDMKWPTFQLTTLVESAGGIVLSSAEAKLFLQTHEKLFPEIKEWQVKLVDRVHKERILRNLFGYPRQFRGRWDDEAARDALSWGPQSTVACITHKAVVNLRRYIVSNKKPWAIVGNKHDSLICHFPIADEAEWLAASKAAMELTLTSSRGEQFTMRSEALTGFNMGKYNPDSNPEGLREVQ